MTFKNKQHTIDEQLLLSAAKSTLCDNEQGLDNETLDRLARIRRDAVEAASRKKVTASSWLLPVGGFVTAAVMVASVMLWTASTVPDSTPVAAIEDINLLTDSEGIEFYQDLEFYQWLAVNEQTVS